MEQEALGRLGRAELLEITRCQQRYRTHRDSLYVFLDRDDVEPTSDSSERDLRPSVTHRKVTGGLRSAWGLKRQPSVPASSPQPASKVRTCSRPSSPSQVHHRCWLFLPARDL